MAVHARTSQLTERQRMVVAHVRQGYSNREIGEKLGISEEGVKAHLSRLYLRYGVTNRVELITTVDETAGYPSAGLARSGRPEYRSVAPSGSSCTSRGAM